jgi:predicted RND superfamily exporter protein
MSEGTKNILKLIGVLIACYIGYRIVIYALHLALNIAIPVLIVGGIGYAIYRATGGKALMGGRKTLP